MISRREFLQAGVAASAIFGAGALPRLAAAQGLTQARLLDMPATGNVTLLHITDIHAQLRPVWFREPSVNIGVGDMRGLVPHLTGADFLRHYNLTPGSPEAYALSSEGFVELAKQYGRMGGLDRIATVVRAVRAERGDKVLLLDGGDTWQGSYTALQTRGQDVIDAMNLLQPGAMTSHWDFVYGLDRVKEIVAALPFAFLGGNIFDAEWNEPAFESTAWFEPGGVKVAVIGQAFPYLPIANPSWLFPGLSFGIREDTVQENVDKARAEGAELVVLLSHNGFDVDRKLAGRVRGIDVILTGHTHDALPEPLMVGDTMLIGTGSHGKFVARLDLDVRGGAIRDHSFRLIPIFSDVIAPDPEMAAVIDGHRAPHEAAMREVLGRTESLLYRRGNFNGSFDDLICQAMLEEREADIALSPGFRWGPSLLPGEDITVEDVYSATSLTYPAVYRTPMTGETLKLIIEDVADNLFNPDPYYQQGGDMVRIGGMGYRIDVGKPIGERVSEMTILKTGERVEAAKQYVVSGWASVNEGTEGPAIWDVVAGYLRRKGTVAVEPNRAIEVIGA